MHNVNSTKCWACMALFLVLLLTGGCGSGGDESAAEPSESANENLEDEAKADFEATYEVFMSIEDEDEKFQVWIDFIDRNPDGSYTANMINYMASQYFVARKNDTEGAITFIEERLNRMTGIHADEVRGQLAELYGKIGDADKILGIAKEMEENGGLSYRNHIALANAASAAQSWEMAIEHAQAAVAASTPDTVKEMAGDQEISDADLQNRANNLKGSALTTLGSIYKDSGDIDAALESYGAAEEFVMFNYIGVATSNINYQWAQALIDKGDYQAAMQRITPDVLYGGTKTAMEIFKDAYLKSGGNEAEIENTLENLRAKMARSMPEFNAFDFDGNKVAWNDIKGRVTLLAFYFPT